MADLNNEMINTAVEGAAEAAEKIAEEVAPKVKKGVSKVVVAVGSAVVGFGAGVAAKIGWDKHNEKKAQQAIEQQDPQPQIIETDVVSEEEFIEE